MWKRFLHNRNKSRGQNIVEYGLIIALIAIITIQIIDDTNNKTRALIQDIVGDSYNENQISLNLPDAIAEWDEKDNLTNPPPRPPVAFFSVTNPVYAGDDVKFWDGSFDPDGDSLNYNFQSSYGSLNFTDTFSFPRGEHTITLKVTDSTGMSDTYSTTLYVDERKPYTKIMTIQKTPDSEPVGEPNIIEKTSEDIIIDHQFDERSDLYGVNHIVIEENYVQTTTYRELTQEYQVTVPKYKVTFDGNGNILNTSLVENIQYTDSVTNPYPAKIESEWEDNTWTFYVYEEISSVRNQVMSSIGSGPRSPSADKPRFAKSRDASEPDTMETAKEITQNPSRVTSRDSQKIDEKATGWEVSDCPYCTIPNRFWSRSSTTNSGTPDGTQTDLHHNLTCSKDGYSDTENDHTYDRRYNWIDHEALDVYYKYTGTANDSATGQRIELSRNTWRTYGWQNEEQEGDGTARGERPKFDQCTEGEYNGSCWNARDNTVTKTFGEEDDPNNDDDSDSGDCGCSYGSDSWSWSIDYYRIPSISCNFVGIDQVGETSLTFSYDFHWSSNGCNCPDPPDPPADSGSGT